MEVFHYQALDQRSNEVRFLELCLSPNQQLCCKIKHAALHEVEYQALSYVWGSQDKPFAIAIIDEDNKKVGQLPLTTNLHGALNDLWQSPAIAPKTFWIDQICINQDDDIEKGHQVQLMGDIYTRAAQVITYLGAGTAYDAAAIDFINKVYQHYEANLRLLAISGLRDPAGLRQSLPVVTKLEHNHDETAIAAVVDMAFGDWTQRVWLVQENYLSPRTVFLRGHHVISWIAIGYIPVLMYLRLLEPDLISKALPKASLRHAWTTAFESIYLSWERRVKMSFFDWPDRLFENTLRNNVRIYSNLRCHDPRDHIFAFLAMSKDRDELGIVPDYLKSVPEVFIDASTRLLKTGDLGHFYQISTLDNLGDPTIPSWSLAPTQVNVAGNGPWTNCYAHPIKDGKFRFDDTGRVLVCRGRIIDRVRFASRSVPLPGSAEWSIEMEASSLPELYSYAQALDHPGITEDALIDVLAVVVTSRKPTSKDARGFAFIMANNWLEETSKLEYNILSPDQLKEGSELMARIQQLASPSTILDDPSFQEFLESWNARIAYGRKFGFSCKGRSFNANSKTQEDDVIAVLQGANSPFVLRHCPGKECYQLVGDIWVNEVMQGELYAGVDADDVDYDIQLV